MPKPIWYRSLYWRIALGFVALLGAVLVVQVWVFLWMTGRMTDLFPSRSPAQFAATLAADLSQTLSQHPDTNVETYVSDHYARSTRGFVVALADGRTIVSKRVAPPPMLARQARSRLFEELFPSARRPRPPWAPGFDPNGRGGGFGGAPQGGRNTFPQSGRDGAPQNRDGLAQGRGDGFGGGRQGFGGGPGRGGDGFGGPAGQPLNTEFTQILVDAEVLGLVAVPRDPPPISAALRDLGPTLALVALGLLTVGTAVAALVIFRPANRRLHELQEAARALGGGATGVRAPETGGDEVTSLARAFNDMAGQLEQRTLALENADRTRRQLLADVSHELTTPLAAIRGYVETLGMTDIELDEASRARYLAIVTEETERLEHIVGDLLDLARLEGGGGTFRVEDVAVAQLLERVRHRHEPLVREKQVALNTVQDATATTVPGDPNRLEQALQNLVANAVRHTPTGGTVTVTAFELDGHLVLRVDDSGAGIPPEHLPRIFDRFYKVDESRTGTPLPSGSGLGLSIVRAIVQRHGGTVTASNLPDHGARFEISLPAGRVAAGDPPPPAVGPLQAAS